MVDDKYCENIKAKTVHQSIDVELRKLKSELKRVTEERDIFMEAALFFANKSKANTRS